MPLLWSSITLHLLTLRFLFHEKNWSLNAGDVCFGKNILLFIPLCGFITLPNVDFWYETVGLTRSLYVLMITGKHHGVPTFPVTPLHPICVSSDLRPIRLLFRSYIASLPPLTLVLLNIVWRESLYSPLIERVSTIPAITNRLWIVHSACAAFPLSTLIEYLTYCLDSWLPTHAEGI